MEGKKLLNNSTILVGTAEIVGIFSGPQLL